MSASKVVVSLGTAGNSFGIYQSLAQGPVLMSSELPAFRKVQRSYAAALAHSALAGPHGSSLLQLIEFDDHHFRAIFDLKQFQLAGGTQLPSKSQWNSLKKRLKRRDRSIFIFRQYGPIDCGSHGKVSAAQTCLYLDFGFLVY
ncbi:MAG: hypothetical protein OXG23_16240 [Chloroflexi bacterium]|nr:hypothetical protein [Chloroflexota bacterium]